jgi:CBS domain-containing protein
MTIEQALRREKVRNLPRPDPASVLSGTSLGDTLKTMRAAGGAAVLVCRGPRAIGIFTERDVLNKLFDAPVDETLPIDRFMTADPASLPLDATLGDAVRLMTEKGYRNIPLVDADGNSAGMIAARDIVYYVAEHFPTEVANLPPSMEQVYTSPDGA